MKALIPRPPKPEKKEEKASEAKEASNDQASKSQSETASEEK